MLFTVTCFDRPGSAQLREEKLPDHLHYLGSQGTKLHAGGPLTDPVDGSTVGSLYIADVGSYDEARALVADEPLRKAGLCESVTVRGWTEMKPTATSAAGEAAA